MFSLQLSLTSHTVSHLATVSQAVSLGSFLQLQNALRSNKYWVQAISYSSCVHYKHCSANGSKSTWWTTFSHRKWCDWPGFLVVHLKLSRHWHNAGLKCVCYSSTRQCSLPITCQKHFQATLVQIAFHFVHWYLQTSYECPSHFMLHWFSLLLQEWTDTSGSAHKSFIYLYGLSQVKLVCCTSPRPNRIHHQQFTIMAQTC